MKAKDFESKLSALEKSGMDTKQASELLAELKKYGQLYNPILTKQYENRLIARLQRETCELNIIPIQEYTEVPTVSSCEFVVTSTTEYANLDGICQEIDCAALIVTKSSNSQFSGKVETSAIIRDCRGCSFKVAVSQLRIYNCHDCLFEVDTCTRPVIEDSSGLVFSALGNKEEGNMWHLVKDFSMNPGSFALKF